MDVYTSHKTTQCLPHKLSVTRQGIGLWSVSGSWYVNPGLPLINIPLHQDDCHPEYDNSWWRYKMETFSALLALCTRNYSPHKGQRLGVLMFSLICALNKRLSKQSWGWWFETLWRSLWPHCNAAAFSCILTEFIHHSENCFDTPVLICIISREVIY